MADALESFTPEAWEAAKQVLSGETDDKISWAAAARAAGVPLHTLKAWVRRSADRRVDDDPLIYEVAEFVDQIDELQTGRLEDIAWERSVSGWDEPVFHQGEHVDNKRKFDHRLLTRFLETRDKRWRKQIEVKQLTVDDASEIQRRLLAGQRLAEAEENKRAIDLAEGEYEVVHDVPLVGYEEEDFEL